MLILSSLSKIQVDELDRFFFGCLLPGDHSTIMGVVVPHEFNGMSCRDIVLPHEVSNLWVRFNLPGGFCGLSLGEAVSLRWGSSSSSLPRVSLMLG